MLLEMIKQEFPDLKCEERSIGKSEILHYDEFWATLLTNKIIILRHGPEPAREKVLMKVSLSDPDCIEKVKNTIKERLINA